MEREEPLATDGKVGVWSRAFVKEDGVYVSETMRNRPASQRLPIIFLVAARNFLLQWLINLFSVVCA